MLLQDAKKLTTNDTIYHCVNVNADGSPQRWIVNGKVKTWKRDPDRVQVPLKHGMYSYGYLTERNINEFSLSEEKALNLNTNNITEEPC